MDVDTVLSAIASTSESDFNEVCRGLGGDCPDKGDRAGWADLFATLRNLEQDGYINIFRDGSRMEGFMLTEQGAAHIRSKMDARRGLFGGLSNG